MASAARAPPPTLSREHRQITADTAGVISNKLGSRVRRLAFSNHLPDFYEALTAVVYVASSACSLNYVSKQKRLESFAKSGWEQLGYTQTVEDMAETGFYSMCDADHVKCFFCDLGLRDWERGDNPETEHAKFSPLCFYLKSSLGLDGLRTVTPQTTNYPPSYARQDHSQLLRTIGEEFSSPTCLIACQVGLDDTMVLLCVARQYIRFRQRWSLKDLVSNVQDEWERELLNDPKNLPQFLSQRQLAQVVRDFYKIILTEA